jgi:lipocalin
MVCSCKKEVDVLELQVAGNDVIKNDVIKNAFDNKKWYCHKQTPTPSFQAPDITNVTAEYSLGKNNVVQIKNCGLRPNGTQNCVSFLRGTLPNGETKAKFVVKPWFVPSIFERKTNYWILDQTKECMIVSAGNPEILEPNCVRKPEDGQGLWILTNSAMRDETVIGNALNKIKDLGINSVDMVDIQQK